MKALKVVAVASSEQTRAALYSQLQDLDFVDFGGVSLELSDAARECMEIGPDVIIVDTTGRELDAGLFIQTIGMNPKNPCVIYALNKEMDIELFRDTIRQGAKEFIQYPEEEGQIQLDTALRKHYALIDKMATQHDARMEANGSVSEASFENGKIIVVFGAKGGAGATTIATNLAYELVQKRKSVALIDLDQVFSNIAVNLGLKPGHSMGDLAETDAADLDKSVLDQITIKHPTGINLISGSKNVLDDNEMITPELMTWLFDTLVTRYGYVIVDLPTHVLDPYHQFLVERADDIVVVTTPDIPGLFRTRQYLDLAQKYLDMDKIRTVINRHNLKAAAGMTNQQVEEQFPYPIFARLPNDWELNVEANSHAKLFSQISPNAELTKAMQGLAAKLVGETGQAVHTNGASKSSGILGKLFAAKKDQQPTGKT